MSVAARISIMGGDDLNMTISGEEGIVRVETWDVHDEGRRTDHRSALLTAGDLRDAIAALMAAKRAAPEVVQVPWDGGVSVSGAPPFVRPDAPVGAVVWVVLVHDGYCMGDPDQVTVHQVLAADPGEDYPDRLREAFRLVGRPQHGSITVHHEMIR